MDLHMFPSAADTFHTQGLCGTLNGRTDDDFTKPDGQITGDNNVFAKSWSVTDEDENLITMSADNLEKLTSWNKTENTQFCTCNGPSRNISCVHDAIATCVRDEESPVVKKKGCKLKRSRSLRPISSMTLTTQPSIVGPQQQIWNMSTATAYCEKFMKDSTSFDACVKQVPATNSGDSIDTCVLDIMATQTTMWATSARESLKSVCQKELKQNTTYQEEDSPDKPSIAQQIKEITCPNECSGHGQCDNGSCLCIAYFGTADCSVDIRIPPHIHGVNLDTNSTCDMNACSMALVEGETFVDTATLTCHITVYKIQIDGTEKLYKQFTTSGQFNTLMEVFCPLPHTSSDEFAQRWSIGVSNDGQHVGKESDLIVYNGNCQKVEHDNVSSVQMQDNFCFIGGVCVPEGNINPMDSCWICQMSDPASRYQWSRNLANAGCKDTFKETTTVRAVLPFFEIHKPTVNVSLVNTFSPILSVEVQALQFGCDFTLLSEDLLYEVVWYIDGKAINETKVANRTELEQLVLEEGAGQLEQLGVHVACAVRARLLPDGVFGRLSPTSDPFYAGIKSTPSVTLHRETPTAYIVVKPTVPIGCPAFFQDGCEAVVELILPETYKCRANIGAVLPTGAQTCGKHILHDEWDKEHKIYIAWLDDQTYNGHPDSYKVSLRTAVNNYNPIWSNVVLEDVNVIMDDNTNLWKGKECHAICDPHMKTFDGRNYENQNPGTFILYENDDPNKKVQVQMTVTPCNPPAHVFCVCAIAVRAGGDVFVIDRCPGIYRPIFEFRSCEDHILDVRKINENLYKIYLPSGTYLSTNLRHYTGKDVMDLHMYPSAADMFHTQGLCGTLNGQMDDDFAEPDGQITGDNNVFARSWRVTDKDNLITMSADALENLETWNNTENVQFCTCNGPSRNISCTHGAIATCVRDDESPVVKQNGCRVRKSRSLLPTSLMPNTTPPVLVGPQQQIWNMTIATDYCEKFLRDSTSFDACTKQVPATDPGNSIDICVLDIIATQTTMWATSARESLKSVCLKELKQNTTYQEEDTPDKPSIAQQIKEITCPNECSGHGQCDNGTCACSTYFGAADCSVDIRKPPHIYGVNLDTNSTCDLNKCHAAIVEGETFIDTSSITCHNTLYQIQSDGTETKFMQWTSHAQFNTLVEVFCPIPNSLSHPKKNQFAYRWSVGVSNDGHHPGDVFNLIVYDGLCQNVVQNGTLLVEMEVNFCFIDGTCIPEGNTHPSDSCRVCQTADPHSIFQWSRNPGYCIINGECIVDGQAKSDDNCSRCDVSISMDQWISLTGLVDCGGRQLNTSIFGLKNETYSSSITDASTTTVLTTPISETSSTLVPASTPATRSDIECQTNQISLHVPLSPLPVGQQVTWNDPSCVVAKNGTHLVGSIGLGDCGTYVVFNSTHVTFENELVSHVGHTSGIHNGIDYGSGANSVIVVQCVYPRREQGSTAFLPVQGHIRFYEKSIGHMQVHMRQARDATFTDTYPSQTEPRKVHLNDELFVKLTTDQGSPSKVAINVDRCLATPSPSPLDTNFQELTNNGCPVIPSVTIHSSQSSEVHLSFRAFQFSSHPGAPVYVHCEVYVCPLSNPQCVTGCTNNAVRSRRAAVGGIKSHLVSTGPFPVADDKEQGVVGGQSTALIAVTGLCACLAVAATVFGILAWKGRKRPTSKEVN